MVYDFDNIKHTLFLSYLILISKITSNQTIQSQSSLRKTVKTANTFRKIDEM